MISETFYLLDSQIIAYFSQIIAYFIALSMVGVSLSKQT